MSSPAPVRQGLASDRRWVAQDPQIASRLSPRWESGVGTDVDQRPTSPRHTSDEEMQLVNKDRQRKIRNELLSTIPPKGTEEREM